MKNYHISLLIMLFMSQIAYADIAVIVHPSNNATPTSDEIQRLFLGKTKSFPGGSDAVAFNLKEGNASRTIFNQAIVGKNGSQLKAYWSQLVFTGKGTPPKEAVDEDEMKKWVASTPAAIGYIDAEKVDSSVKVLLKQ